jgi:hypothetical protein
MVALSDIETSLKALNEKLDWIIQRLDYLEAVLTESQQYPEVLDFLRSLRVGTALYGEPLKTLDRLISVQRLVTSSAQRDEISKIILHTLALHGSLNLSQLTREVRSQRGRASRVTVRKRAKALLQTGAVRKDGTVYTLAQ